MIWAFFLFLLMRLAVVFFPSQCELHEIVLLAVSRSLCDAGRAWVIWTTANLSGKLCLLAGWTRKQFSKSTPFLVLVAVLANDDLSLAVKGTYSLPTRLCHLSIIAISRMRDVQQKMLTELAGNVIKCLSMFDEPPDIFPENLLFQNCGLGWKETTPKEIGVGRENRNHMCNGIMTSRISRLPHRTRWTRRTWTAGCHFH